MRNLSLSQKILITVLTLMNVLLVCMIIFSYIQFTKKRAPIELQKTTATAELSKEPSDSSKPVTLKPFQITHNDSSDYSTAIDYGTEFDSSYMLPDSDSRYITEEDLWEFSKEELRIARNEIYARHGYVFGDDALQAYFNSKSWYTPNEEVAKDTLAYNEYEKANSKFIQSIEDAYNTTY